MNIQYGHDVITGLQRIPRLMPCGSDSCNTRAPVLKRDEERAPTLSQAVSMFPSFSSSRVCP